MNAKELIAAWNDAKGDLPKEQAFLFQHCQEAMQMLEEQQEELSEYEKEYKIEYLGSELNRKDELIARLVQRIRQLEKDNDNLANEVVEMSYEI